MTIKICAISDTHGYLPKIPKCDIFLHCGDISPIYDHDIRFQAQWILDEFKPWLKNIQARHKVIIAGNHDFIFEHVSEIRYNLPCEVLNNELTEIEGLKIWGSPWTLKFFDWAFNAKARDLYKLHTSIPKCDIIITHGPPYGFGDVVSRKCSITGERFKSHCGSPGLIRKILEVEPRYVFSGHIHGGFGTRQLGKTTIANVAYVAENYKPANSPQIYEI